MEMCCSVLVMPSILAVVACVVAEAGSQALCLGQQADSSSQCMLAYQAMHHKCLISTGRAVLISVALKILYSASATIGCCTSMIRIEQQQS